MSAAGVLLGAVSARASLRLMSSLVFGVSAVDPVSFAAACAIVLAAGLIASAVPAIRAGRVAPILALKGSA